MINVHDEDAIVAVICKLVFLIYISKKLALGCKW